MPFPSNMLEISVALLYKPYGMGKRDDVVENEALRSLTYPVRLVLWAACMCLFYPIMLATALLTALVLRLTSGTAADVLRHSLSASFKTGASYPCLFVFKKPLADQARLRAAWKELAAEVGMNPARVGIDFPEEVPRPFPEGPAVEADHYVDRGVSLFKRACVVMGGWHAYIEVNNGAPGAPASALDAIDAPNFARFVAPGSQHGVGHLRIFVKSGGESDWVRKVETPQRLSEDRVRWRSANANQSRF